MATTLDDIRHEEMLQELHFEAVMQNEALKQCIYIFVEGDSELSTFETLLEGVGLDLQRNGFVIASYGGIGNLKHAIRLLRNTLSHDRPVIVTYDDDIAGKETAPLLNAPLVTPFRIPSTPVVTYSDGSKGGSFEEAFNPQSFTAACFAGTAIDEKVRGLSSEFANQFDPTQPWVSQIAQFIQTNGGNPSKIKKVEIAEHMAENCDPVPQTFHDLANVADSIRKAHPVEHPDNVEF